MLLELAQRLKINLNEVPMIGDSARDLQAARAAGALPVLVRTGNGMETAETLSREESLNDVPVFDDLAAFTNDFLRNSRSRL